jgi:hypothetical protein
MSWWTPTSTPKALEKMDMQRRIVINRMLDFPVGPDNAVWLDEMSYHYDSHLTRWMLMLPSIGTTSSRSQSVHGLRNTMDLPLQTQDGTLTMVANNIPIPFDDNVEMGEVGEPPDVMEEDNPATLSAPLGTL